MLVHGVHSCTGHTISANAPFLFWNNDVIALPQENPEQAGVVVNVHTV